MSKYGVFAGPYFPAFGLNTERYAVSLRIQSKCGKILRISPYSVRLRENTKYLSVFSPNAGKYGPEKTPIWTLFKQ